MFFPTWRIARRRFGVVLAVTMLVGTCLAAQAPDEEVWQAFVQWLRQAPPLDGPLDALQGFERSVASSSAGAQEAARQQGVVRRMMNTRADGWPLLFDRIYASDRPKFSQNPSPVLAAAIVTGFDVSDGGLAVARANAAKAGVALTAVHSSFAAFDYGTAQWDLIAMVYVPAAAFQGAEVARVTAGLAPGGLLVIESFASDVGTPMRRPVDIDPTELKASLGAFEILRFGPAEDAFVPGRRPEALTPRGAAHVTSRGADSRRRSR
jgi:hypothetical protein